MAPVLQPHQQRVVDEKHELDEKLEKLTAFIEANPLFASPAIAEAERCRLRRQHEAMSLYSQVLGERIAAFDPATVQKTLAELTVSTHSTGEAD